MRNVRATRRRTRRRGAVLSIELLVALPVLLTVIAASVEFGLLMTAHGAVSDASRTAARLASLGVTDGDVLAAAVRTSLGPRLGGAAGVSVVPEPATETVTVAVTVPMSAAAPNLLWPIGYDLSGRTMTAASCMPAELN